MELKFTVLFEELFWLGIAERTDEAGYTVAQHIFGAEPSAPEIYTYVLRQWKELAFSAPLPGEVQTREVNYKRQQREARHALTTVGVASKAHEAMRLELEAHTQVKKETSKVERETEKTRQFQLAQERKKEKHRGH